MLNNPAQPCSPPPLSYVGGGRLKQAILVGSARNGWSQLTSSIGTRAQWCGDGSHVSANISQDIDQCLSVPLQLNRKLPQPLNSSRRFSRIRKALRQDD